jgi:CDP-glycerol glycerophosphotransferase (TagB/SpsB family)
MSTKIINILLTLPVIFLSFFINRKESYFSFGDWFGEKCSDSSFYIFKEASKENKLNVAWITKSDEIYTTLNKEKYTCYKANSFQGIVHQLSSWSFISTVNSFDFYPPALLGQKNYVQLNHGPPIKKYFKDKLTKFQKIRFYIRSKTIENYSYYASYGVFNSIIKFQYSIDDSKILEIPPARCDFFFNTSKIDVLRKLNLDKNQVYITYLPTHRNEGKSIDAIIYNLRLIDNILIELKLDYKVLFKPHFYDYNKFKNHDFNYEKIMFNPDWNSDELMLVSELFIGDYSGVIFDYFNLNKFEIGLCTDYENYRINHRDLYFNLKDIYQNLAKDGQGLKMMFNKFKDNSLNKTDSGFVWKKENNISFSEIAWNEIKKTLK